MRTSNTIAGLLLILVAGTMIYLTLSFPPFPGQQYGPSLFPRILASGLILCGLLLILRDFASGARAPAFVRAEWMREPWRLVSFLLIPATILVYILVSEWVGFIPTAIALLLTLFLWFRVKPLNAVIIAVVATLTVHWFFATMLRVPLPRGLLTNYL